MQWYKIIQQIHKGKYKDKYIKLDIMAVWGTLDGKVNLKQLILFKNQNIDLDW